MATVQIQVSGRVQGVFFRKYTQEKAQTLNINGYVKNLHHNQVIIIAQGDIRQIDDLIQWCWTGSPSSVVTDVSAEEIKSAQLFSEFTVKY